MIDRKHEFFCKCIVLLVALGDCSYIEFLDHIGLELKKEVLVIVEIGILGIPCHDLDQAGHDAVEVDVIGDAALGKLDGKGNVLAYGDLSDFPFLGERYESDVFHLFLHNMEYNKKSGKYKVKRRVEKRIFSLRLFPHEEIPDIHI